MDQKYNISDILDAVNELNQSKPVKKVNSQDYQEPRKKSKEDRVCRDVVQPIPSITST